MTIREAADIVPDVTRMRVEVAGDADLVTTGDDEQIPDADPMAGAIEEAEQAAYVRGRKDGYAAAERNIVAWLRLRTDCYANLWAAARQIEAGAHRPKDWE